MDSVTNLRKSQIDKIRELCQKHHVKELHVFGSLLTDKFSDKSDIDFIASFDDLDFGDYAEAFFGLAEDLEDLLGRKVDLVTAKSLRNPYFIQSIESTKRLLYAA